MPGAGVHTGAILTGTIHTRIRGDDASRSIWFLRTDLCLANAHSVLQHGLVHCVAQLAGLSSRNRGKRLNCRYTGNGYHYEADEVRACIERGACESTVMPLGDSIAVASTADMIRKKILESTNKKNDPA